MIIEKYDLKDVKASFAWLGHAPHFTELSAFHKDYLPGKQHYESNFKNRAFPKIEYAKTAKQVERFVKKNYKDHLLCFGLNPRTQVFVNNRNFPRSAKESEIELVKNVLFDFDFKEKKYLEEKLAELEINFMQFDEYFFDNGLKEKPVRAFTGQGYHLLFATNNINVKEHPDIKMRIKAFQENFKNEFNDVLDGVGAIVDSTYSLSQKIKIYGTAKPSVNKAVSCFFGGERIEDSGLRDYLLNMKLPEIKETSLDEKITGELPKLFVSLLERDQNLKNLWMGEGKNNGDSTRSGYDFSLTQYLLKLGFSDLDQLKQILIHRPNGAVQHGKGDQYVKLTLANAIKHI